VGSRTPEETGSTPAGQDVETGGGMAAPAEPRDYKRPESVLVVVFTADQRFLMLRRRRPSAFWQSVTGSLKRGESPRRAALRELVEETGLVVSPAALLDLRHHERFPILPAWRARYAPGVHYNLEHWFAVRLPTARLIRLNPREHLEHRWLNAQRAAVLASSWTNRNAILMLAQVFATAP
jgi:dATP pyrophosphohydrolase